MTPSERNPGRPQADEREGMEARDTLIQTAASLFADKGFDGTSLREVAEGAGVTPAMVAYYFRDKSGLLEAVVRHGLEMLLGVISAAASGHEPGRFVESLIRDYLAVIVSKPWIPRILIREVVSKDSPLRTMFVEEFAVHAVALVPAQVADGIQEGVLREDLDPRYAILSLLGMCLFPVIVHPVLGPLLGYELDDAFGTTYGDHVVELFLNGAGGGIS